MDSIPYAHGHLYYHTYGTGEPVIVLSGGPGASYQQQEIVGQMLAATHRAILLEQRGTGRSQPTPFDTSTINLTAALADLNRLLDHLELERAHFYGHSWGGMLAMSFAAAYPERVQSLILANPGPFRLDQQVFDIYYHNKEARLSSSEKEARDAALEKFRAPTASPADRDTYFRWEMVPSIYDRNKVDSLSAITNKGGLNPAMGGLIFRSLFAAGFDLSEPLSAFRRPVHIITGAQDPAAFVSYEIKILLPAAQLHWINQAGHFPMYEQPEAFRTILLDVLARP